MRPISLRFQAFGSFAGEEFIDFDKIRENKLFLISGETGSGKTTILEAITYALYGKSTGGKRGDLQAMRCQYAKQEMPTEIEFTFETGGKTYRFVRQIAFARKNYHVSQNAMVSEDGVFRPLFENPTQANVNKEAEKIIGLAYEQFVKVIILPQGQFEQFLVADSKEKELILVSLFKAEKWQRVANRLFDMLLSKKKELEEKRIRMDTQLREYDCADLEELEKAIENKQTRIADLQSGMKELEEMLSEREIRYQKFNSYVKAKTEYLQKTEQLEKDHLRLKKKCEEKQKESDILLAEEEKWEKTKEETIVLKGLESVYKKIELLAEEKERCHAECQKLTLKKEKAEKDKKTKEEAYLLSQIAESNLFKQYNDAFTDYIQNIAGYLAGNLEDNKPCPVCGSLNHPSKAECQKEAVSKEELDALKEKMESAKKLVEQRNEEKLAAEENFRKAEKDLLERTMARKACEKDYEESLSSRYQNIQNIRELNRAITDGENAYNDYQKKRKAAIETAEQASRELLKTEQEMKVIEENWNKTEAENSDMIEALPSEEEMNQWKLEIAEYKHRQKKEGDTLAVLSAEVEKMKKRSRQLKKELPQLLVQTEETENNLAFAKRLRGDTGVGLQRYVLGVMLSSITVEANRMLEKVHGGRYHIYRTIESSGSARKAGLELEVMDSYSGMRRSVSSLSGGEKFLVAISLAIGLSTVVQAQNGGIRIEALFIDEGFGSLDKQSIGDALAVLGMIHERTNSMIGIISHVDLLKENIPMQLQVHKTKEGSYLWNKNTFM